MIFVLGVTTRRMSSLNKSVYIIAWHFLLRFGKGASAMCEKQLVFFRF